MTRPVLVRIRTRRDVQRRIFALVGSLAAIQFLLDTVDPFLGRRAMAVLRILAAAISAGGAMAFEMYKSRRAPS